jgi:hypothetical protein
MLVLNKPIDVGYEGNWRIVGINNLGLPSMIREISIDWSLISTKELMKMFNQLKSEEYSIQKSRKLYP